MVHAVALTFRGIATAIRARWKTVLGVTAIVSVFNLAAPVAILSIARRPADYFTFNPWLSRLPDYLRSDEPLEKKLSFLGNMAIAWVSADNHVEGIDWGFIIDVPTLAQILVTSLVFGTYFALLSYARRTGFKAGAAGAATTVFGLTTGPCTLAGCGVPPCGGERSAGDPKRGHVRPLPGTAAAPPATRAPSQRWGAEDGGDRPMHGAGTVGPPAG